MEKRKFWTDEEENKLSERWGKYTLDELASQFGRTVCAIKRKANKLKLGTRVTSVDGVSIRALLAVLGWSITSKNYKKLKKYELPYFVLQTESKVFYMVNIDKFWRWAEKHTDIVDVTKIEPLALGKEPAWVYDLRITKSRENYLRRWGGAE